MNIPGSQVKEKSITPSAKLEMERKQEGPKMSRPPGISQGRGDNCQGSTSARVEDGGSSPTDHVIKEKNHRTSRVDLKIGGVRAEQRKKKRPELYGKADL